MAEAGHYIVMAEAGHYIVMAEAGHYIRRIERTMGDRRWAVNAAAHLLGH